MSVWLALTVTAGVILFAVMLGAVYKHLQGRNVLREKNKGDIIPLNLANQISELGANATFVLFSTIYCVQCPAVKRHLDKITRDVESAKTYVVDLTDKPELAIELHIMSTPTIFVLSNEGRMKAKLIGSPKVGSLESYL